MLSQLLIGTGVIAVSVAMTATFIGLVVRALTRIGPWLATSPSLLKTGVVLTCVTIWLILALSVSVWLWAVTYLGLGIFSDLETALYFSVVAFTTLGFGDIVLPTPWRLLAGISAANGLVLFGLITAVLLELLRRLLSRESVLPSQPPER